MKTIRMLAHMTGPRPGGDPWPPPYAEFDVEDWEAEHLARGGLAMVVTRELPPSERPGFYPESPPPDQGPPPGQAMALGPPPGQAMALGPSPVPPDAPDPGPSPVPAEAQDRGSSPAPADAAPPSPADPKDAWIAYAVSQGELADTANRMTKADLQSRYGGRI